MIQVNTVRILILALLLLMMTLPRAVPHLSREALIHTRQGAACSERYVQVLDTSRKYKPNELGKIKRNETKLALQQIVSAEANKRFRGKVRVND